MTRRQDLRLPLFVASVALLYLLAQGLSLMLDRPAVAAILPVLVVVAMLADQMTVQVSSVTVSMMYPVLAATTMLFGPSIGGFAAAVSAIPSGLVAKEKKVLRTFFNTGQLGLVFLCAGWAYVLSGGREIAAAPLSVEAIPSVLAPLLLLAATSLLVNSTLVASVVTLDAGVPFLKVWQASFAWTIPTQASLAVLSLALAEVVASEGLVGLVLFAVPLLIARQFYERYVLLKHTYAETVRSLVAVIEAKDAYTRGHSERVAQYAVGMANQLGLHNDQVERLELAALLHDLGKVGISKGILLKRSQLSDEEYEVIKEHPSIGARIIERVSFLSDLVPLVLNHHQRMDGSGYGSSTSVNDIPVEARILTVADAYDAMTSSRPYRGAMSQSEAVRELVACAGTQFDPAVVQAFIEVLTVTDRHVAEEEDGVDEAV